MPLIDGTAGDLIITFEVIFPNNIGEERIKYLSKLLPKPNRPPININECETVFMNKYTDVSNSDNNEHRAPQEDTFNHDSFMPDFEEGNIQCAQQ